MPIFPEHLHVAGEDARLRDVQVEHQTRVIFDFYIGAIIFAALLVAAAIIVLFTF
jgi:hypothetical protein